MYARMERNSRGVSRVSPVSPTSSPISCSEDPLVSRLRFAVYRNRFPLAPAYLGEVLAVDRADAEQLGAAAFGGSVVAMRASGSAVTSAAIALEHAIARVQRSAARRDAHGHRFSRRSARATPLDPTETTPDDGAA